MPTLRYITKELTHRELKEKGKEILRDKGFREDEIKEEFKLKIGKSNRFYLVDVAGIKDGDIEIAVECGSLKAEKMAMLRELTKEVIHIPHFSKAIEKRDIEEKKAPLVDKGHHAFWVDVFFVLSRQEKNVAIEVIRKVLTKGNEREAKKLWENVVIAFKEQDERAWTAMCLAWTAMCLELPKLEKASKEAKTQMLYLLGEIHKEEIFERLKKKYKPPVHPDQGVQKVEKETK